MTLKGAILPSIISALGVAAVFYLEGSDEDPGLARGERAASLVLATFATLIIYFPLYAFADTFRRWRHWPAWTLCLIAAAFLAVPVLLLCLLPEYESGFYRASDPLRFFATFFLTSLAFGVTYTILQYDSRHRDG